jgi:5'-nucleotidase
VQAPRLPLALILAVLAACPERTVHRPDGPARVEPPVRITIAATNDLHGWVQPTQSVLPDGTVLRAGGLSLLSGYLEILRAQNPGGVVVVDSGDLFQGTLVANLSEGEVVIAAYNALGYDAATIGNHEFDYGPVGPRSAAVNPDDDPLGALAACARTARFPLLARNVRLADGTRPPFLHASTIVERHGIKIGFLGLLTPTTPEVTNPVNVMRLRFGGLVEEAIAGAEELRAQGADVLVALVHAGGKCDDLSDPHSLASCDLRGEIFEMLFKLPSGLFDAVIAGHTHASIGHFVNSMPVAESGAFGRQLGVIELAVDPATRRPIPEKTRIRAAIPVCERIIEETGGCNAKAWKPGMSTRPATFEGAPVQPNEKLDSLMAPYFERVHVKQQQKLAVTMPAALTREYKSESSLGNALADALREMEGADVTLLNSGGLRADLHAGELTYGALYEVFPFDNSIATLHLTGREVTELLEALLSGTHGVPQTSGLRFVVERCPGKSTITEVRFTDGRPFDPDATYRLATSDFLALGGDGVGEVLGRVPAERKHYGHERDLGMRDALAEWFLQRGGTLEGHVDGRMKLIDAPAEACANR